MGVGLSEAPARGTPPVVITPTAIAASEYHYWLTVWMKVGTTNRQFDAVAAAVRNIHTVGGCRVVTATALRRSARRFLRPAEFDALPPIAFSPQITCLVQGAAAVRSASHRLSKRPTVREVQVTYVGPSLQPG
jgi:hypothetical protein